MMVFELARIIANVVDTQMNEPICTPLVEDRTRVLEGSLDFTQAGCAIICAVVDVTPKMSFLSAMMPSQELLSVKRIVAYLLFAAGSLARNSGSSQEPSELEMRMQIAILLVFSEFLSHLEHVNMETAKQVTLLEVVTSPEPYVALSANGISCNAVARAAWGATMMLEENAREYAQHMRRFSGVASLHETCRLMLAVAKTPRSNEPLVFLDLLSTMSFRLNPPYCVS